MVSTRKCRPLTILMAVCALLSYVGTAPAAGKAAASSFVPDKAGFSVMYKDETSPYRITPLFCLPGQVITIRAVHEDPSRKFSLSAKNGKVKQVSDAAWEWRAPAGVRLAPVIVSDVKSGETITLNAFVMAPYKEMKNSCINGYRIGKYPSCPPRKTPLHGATPQGFVEMDEQTGEEYVSPHFQLKQFLCKQESNGDIRYLVLQERLVLKLELLLEEVNKRGIPADTFYIMSGYRTPEYNHAIGNVKFSRHQYGEAADIFIDHDGDGVMDDINHDGKINQEDALAFYKIIESISAKEWYQPYIGGLGAYKRSASHGPFVHVDVRGTFVRWGIGVQTAKGE